MFVAAALLLVLFAIGTAEVGARADAALLWLIILFASAVGLSRSFEAEEERGTTLLLQLHVTPAAVFTGKLLYNTMLTLMLAISAAIGFRILFGSVPAEPALFGIALVGGAIGLAGTSTLLGALIARASGRGPLMAVLAFPLQIPLLLSVVRLTERSLRPPPAIDVWVASTTDLTATLGYCGLVVTAGAMLFDYVWRD
jgi:heme exporter protein B